MEDCKICHGGCCRRYIVPLWGSDIIRISEALEVDMFFFISVVKYEKEKAEEKKKTEPLFIFTEAGTDCYFQIILKSHMSKLYPNTSKCIFLQEWSASAQQSEELEGIIGRCGIYDIRPLTCKTWPVGYDEKNDQVVLNDPYLIQEKRPDRPGDSIAYSICPKELCFDDYKNFEDEYVKSAILDNYERKFFRKIAEKWNKNPDLSDKLYKFIKEEYKNRIKHIKEEIKE